MLTIFTERHHLHDAQGELYGGVLVPPFECPARATHVINRITEVNLGPVAEPTDHGLAPILRIHDADYVTFLQTCWDDWLAAGFTGEMIANSWPGRNMRSDHIPKHIDGRLGYYALAGETAITATSWEAAYWSAQVALTALHSLGEDRSVAFALCRPPGHHAPHDQFGGYCFLNNAAIAAQAALDNGAKRVAILDIDFHHGNGTQSIFYDRSDVLFLSLHGEPDQAYPYFLGWADETGRGAGEGFNVNYPLPPGTDYAAWATALDDALSRITAYGADLVIVSMGLDTFENDPISFFKLRQDDYPDIGRRIAALNLPTLMVMEGGYAVADLGVNAVNILTGFDAQRGTP